ncbi:hypothetical protein CLIM01_09061 [Colletotrichum limetticola]|uniref:Uncharacterized protein n=1 Tax=Colletotrichum limetticola TaxID=1209924 RepID=A0ABQ9PPU8_9PEZI|nr:hypothetical protein CLIM01_09061 [Colletotrichum limetticola]
MDMESVSNKSTVNCFNSMASKTNVEELKPDDGPLHDVEDEHRVSDEHEFQYTRIIMNVLRLNNAASVGKTVRSLTASGPSEILDAYGMIDILVNDKRQSMNPDPPDNKRTYLFIW